MRYELTDYEWAAIRPFLPNKPRRVPRVDDRRVLNGSRSDLAIRRTMARPAQRLWSVGVGLHKVLAMVAVGRAGAVVRGALARAR